MRRAWLVIAASNTRKKKQSASANNLTTRSARVVSSFNDGWKPRHEKAADTIRSYVTRRDPQCGVGCTAVVFLSENQRNTLHCRLGCFCPYRGPPTPQKLESFFFRYFCSFEFSRDRQCHGTRKCPHRLSSNELSRVDVPRQWRTNTCY